MFHFKMTRGTAGRGRIPSLELELHCRTQGETGRTVALDAREEVDFPRKIFPHGAFVVGASFVRLEPHVHRLVRHAGRGRGSGITRWSPGRGASLPVTG